MNEFDPGFLFFTSAVVSLIMAFPIYSLLTRFGIIDRPNERSSHTTPVARGGGVAFLVTIFFVGFLFVINSPFASFGFLFLATSILGIVSFIDDVKGLPAAWRLAIHSVLAAVVIAAIGIPEWSTRLFGWTIPAFIVLILAWFWIVAYTNALNFMDGINGLAAMQATVTATGMAFYGAIKTGTWNSPESVLCLIIAGATAGFLPHNFPHARMFMGDVGSASLGFLLATFCLAMAEKIGMESILPLMFFHLNFVLDSGITLFRRVLRGDQCKRSILHVLKDAQDCGTSGMVGG